MADTYQGIFIRDYLGQVSGTTGSGWSASPDVIPYGTSIAEDPQVFIDQYGVDFGKNVTFNINNYVYIRGKNTTGGEITSRVWFYYTESDLCLWPQNWRSDCVTVAADPRNYMEVTAHASGDIALTNPPFVWYPPTFHSGYSSGDHYCLITMVENPVNGILSDPPVSPKPQGYMSSCDQLVDFIRSHPNMGWRNTVDVSINLPSWQNVSKISGPPDGGQVWIGIQCNKMPTDGYFEFQVAGPDKDNTLIFPKSQINAPNETITLPVVWPKGFVSSMTLTYYMGSTTPPVGASITPTFFWPSSQPPQQLMANNWMLSNFARPVYALAFDSPKMTSANGMWIDVIGQIPYTFKK